MTTVAALSTAIGGAFVACSGKPSFSLLGHMISFAAGVMLYLSFVELLPGAMEEVGEIPAQLAFFIGFVGFGGLLYFVPNKEHSHDIEVQEADKALKKSISKTSLMKPAAFEPEECTKDSNEESSKIEGVKTQVQDNQVVVNDIDHAEEEVVVTAVENGSGNDSVEISGVNTEESPGDVVVQLDDMNENENENESKTDDDSATTVAATGEEEEDVSAENPLDDLVFSAVERAHLLKTGLITAAGIALHNFPEGVAVYLSSLQGLEVGLPLTFSIALHNIPEGMAVAFPIYNATGSRWQAFLYSLLSGLCELFGAVLFGIIFRSVLTERVVTTMLAGVAGIMVFICVKELYPTSSKYLSSGNATVSNVIGMAVTAAGLQLLSALG